MGLLFLVFTALPALELYILIKTGQAIGALNTLACLILSGLIGSYLVKNQARGLLNKVNESISRGQLPAEELVNALCLFIGGLLMISPGFLTDAIGIMLVFPPTRSVLKIAVRAYFARLVKTGRAKFHVVNINNASRYTSYKYASDNYPKDVTPKSEEPKQIDVR